MPATLPLQMTTVHFLISDMVSCNKCHGIVAIPGQGIAPWHAALTDSDIVTVGDTPVTVERVMLLRPVMSDALVSSCLIHKVDDGLATDTHDGSSNNHVGCDALCHCRIE